MDQSESPPAPTPEQTPPAVSPIDSDKADIEQNKDIAAFSYLWIMSVVVFFLRRKSPFVRYHAKQAMILFALSVIVLLVPYISRFLELGVLALMVYGFINAAQGLRKDVPIVGPLSRREITIRQAWKMLVDAIVRGVNAIKSLIRSRTSSSPSSSSSSSQSAPPTPPSPPSSTPTI